MKRATARAIRLLGGTRPAARLLQVTAGTVNYWKQRGQIPSSRVLDVEKAIGEEPTQCLSCGRMLSKPCARGK